MKGGDWQGFKNIFKSKGKILYSHPKSDKEADEIIHKYGLTKGQRDKAGGRLGFTDSNPLSPSKWNTAKGHMKGIWNKIMRPRSKNLSFIDFLWSLRFYVHITLIGDFFLFKTATPTA